METAVEQQGELPMVTPLSFSATRWPATPAKVSTAFWPGAVVATVTGVPPGASEPPTSSGTSNA
jgi:hypothetical protein